MAYNPYNEIKAVYDAKINWGKATTDEERNKQNAIATAARDRLKEYGYGNVADQVSADGADAATVKRIMDNWAAKVDTVTGNYKTGVDNPAYNQAVTSATNKNDAYFNTIKNDHSNVNSKYDSIFNYANSDITQTDEYKSAFENIMPSYTLAAMQGRNNESAKGAASNSGNIDSYAAANALRQQAALTAKGQQLAHQAGVDAVNARLQNAQHILSNLGVYNSGVYSAMSDSINNDRNMANDIFNNEQTALNNDIARKSEMASVTGYAPDEWVVSNNPYMNDDGTLKAQYLTKEFDDAGGFTTIMQNARAAGNTEAYNAAAVARYYKLMSDYGKYGKYDNGEYVVPGLKPTEERRQFDEQIAAGDRALKTESNTNLALADKEAALTQQQINASLEAARLENEKDAYAAYNVLLSMWPVNETEKRAFVEESIKPIYEGKQTITPEGLKQLIVTNSQKYNIDVDDATKICQAFGVPTDWLSGYRDRTEADGDVTWYDGSSHKGQYGGMVAK